MSVKELGHDKIIKMSMVDVASYILNDEKQPLSFLDAFNKVATLKEWNDDMKKSKIAQFYTDLNMDGRFITNGSNTWGLKRWYKLDEISEDLTNASMETLEVEFEDEESSFLKAPGFEDEDDDEEDEEDDEDDEELIGFEDPEEAEEGFDDEYEDEEDEDFGEDYDGDEDED